MTPPELIALLFALHVVIFLSVWRSDRRVQSAVERERAARRVRESGRRNWRAAA